MTDDIFALVKSKNKLEDVMAEGGHKLEGRGRYRRIPHSGGLVIDTHNQTWHHNIEIDRWGDVIDWIQREHKLDKKEAVNYLAKRAGLPEPEWNRSTSAHAVAARQKQDALKVAAQVFAGWFWKSDDAKAYAVKRGWTIAVPGEDGKESLGGTARAAMLGFSGIGTDEEKAEMRKAFDEAGIDPLSPAAVAVLGFRGDVSKWTSQHLEGKTVNDLPEDWNLNGYIPGMVGRERLVYVHRVGGRVVYLSGRAIRDKFHWNVPKELAGERQPFYNQEYSPSSETCVIVEGQADAISLGQLGISAVALNGAKLKDGLAETLKERHKAIVVWADMDAAGIHSAWRSANELGPMTRITCGRDPMGFVIPTSSEMTEALKKSVDDANAVLMSLSKVFNFPIKSKIFDSEKPVKDANDLLISLSAANLNESEQKSATNSLLLAAPTFAELAAAWAGTRQGALRDQAVRIALGVITRMGEMDYSNYRSGLAKSLGVGVRELGNLLKTYKEESAKSEAAGEPELTWGGFFHGWIVDYLYDKEKDQALLAWRDPNGTVGSGPAVSIEGKRYEPYPPTESLQTGAILFPSKLGERKDIANLVGYIESYLNAVYLLPNKSTARLLAYYVLSTWVYDCFDALAYLAFMGDTGSGKSELMFRVGMVCYRPITASGASTVASLFRMVHRYKGSVIIDEADLQQSDTTQDMVKFYNQGAMKGRPITRLVDVVLPDGRHDYQEQAFQVYCPKLMTIKKNFQDDAVTSRSLVIKLQPREMVELMNANIPLSINQNIREKTQALRNLLIRFRLEYWQPQVEMDNNFYELTVSARLNQITGGLLAIAKDDPVQQEQIRENLREYYRDSQVTKSMSITARVIEALWKLWKFPDLTQLYVRKEDDGRFAIKIGDITKTANEIIDQMNETEDEMDSEEDKKFRKKGIKPHTVGRIVREELQLEVSRRRRDGFWVYWNEDRMRGVALRYGIDLDQVGPTVVDDDSDEKAAKQPEQGKLV